MLGSITNITSPVALVVLCVLLAFSVVSWAIIIMKWFSLYRAQKLSTEFSELFWKIKRLDDVYDYAKNQASSPLARIFQRGYHEMIRAKEDRIDAHGHMDASAMDNIQHALRRSCVSEVSNLEKMIPFLATVGSTSPFIGLFGTVVGIMNSFKDIGAQGSASLATVAPGMSEALIATAAGLLAAIPAVIAYNYFATRIRNISTDIDVFAADFLNMVRRQLH